MNRPGLEHVATERFGSRQGLYAARLAGVSDSLGFVLVSSLALRVPCK